VSYVKPADFRAALLAALRAWTVEPLKSAVFRIGPCRSVRLAGTEDALVIVSFMGLEGGERSAGSGNNWFHNPAFEVLLAVPDDEDDPETTDTNLLALLDEFGSCIHANRSIASCRVVHFVAAPVLILPLFENTQQVFRAIPVDLRYQTLKGG
jgi:hypothetical protein